MLRGEHLEGVIGVLVALLVYELCPNTSISFPTWNSFFITGYMWKFMFQQWPEVALFFFKKICDLFSRLL